MEKELSNSLESEERKHPQKRVFISKEENAKNKLVTLFKYKNKNYREQIEDSQLFKEGYDLSESKVILPLLIKSHETYYNIER